MNPQPLSPQGYNIQKAPVNRNPFWEEEGTGGNVPAGGTTGQVLTKRTDADYDTEWKTPEAGGSGLPEGGTAGDLLAKTSDGAEWITPDYPTADDLSLVEDAAEAAQQAANTAAAAVTTETRAREAADTALGERIDDTAQEISDYKTTTNQALADLRSADTAEADARAAADTALGSRIDGVASDLQHYEEATDAELQAQDAEDQRLSGLISAESSARMDADALLRQDLTADIQAEQQQREAADTAIRALISAAEGDIGDVGALVESIDTRVTANETDIADLKPVVQSAKETADAAAAAAAEAGAAAAAVRQIPRVVDPSTGEAYGDSIDNTRSYPESGIMTLAYNNATSAPPHSIKWLNDRGTKVRLPGGTFKPFALLSAGVSAPLAPQASFSTGEYPIIGVTNWLKGLVISYPEGETSNAIEKGVLLAGTGHSVAGENASKTAPISGGTTGQVLTKKSDTDYDWEWRTPEAGGSGLPEGGTAGDLLAKTANGAEWITPDFPTTEDLSRVEDAAEAAQLAANAAAAAVTTETQAREAADTALVTRKPITLANEVKPTGILAAPFVYISPTGEPKFYGTTDYQAPDAWADLHKNAPDYSAAPIYYDTILDGGAIVMQNATYGDSQGRVYLAVPNKAGASWRFDIPRTGVPSNSAPTAELVVRLTSVEDPNLTLYARATCQLPIQFDDTITVKAWWHKVWPSENHVGGPGDVSFTINLGPSGWRVYVGIDGNFFVQFFGNGSTGAGYRWRTYHAADFIIGIK